jgi:hypothetical protein
MARRGNGVARGNCQVRLCVSVGPPHAPARMFRRARHAHVCAVITVVAPLLRGTRARRGGAACAILCWRPASSAGHGGTCARRAVASEMISGAAVALKRSVRQPGVASSGNFGHATRCFGSAAKRVFSKARQLLSSDPGPRLQPRMGERRKAMTAGPARKK